jgi:hypothetical protein
MSTIVYFGSQPTSIVIQATSDMTGAAPNPAVPPTILEGVYLFAPVAGSACGQYNFHDVPIIIKGISFFGGGTLTVKKYLTQGDVQIGQFAAITTDLIEDVCLGAGEYLTFTTSGSTNPKVSVTAKTAMSEFGT